MHGKTLDLENKSAADLSDSPTVLEKSEIRVRLSDLIQRMIDG